MSSSNPSWCLSALLCSITAATSPLPVAATQAAALVPSELSALSGYLISLTYFIVLPVKGSLPWHHIYPAHIKFSTHLSGSHFRQVRYTSIRLTLWFQPCQRRFITCKWGISIIVPVCRGCFDLVGPSDILWCDDYHNHPVTVWAGLLRAQHTDSKISVPF